jgi:hypothetical protein
MSSVGIGTIFVRARQTLSTSAFSLQKLPSLNMVFTDATGCMFDRKLSFFQGIFPTPKSGINVSQRCDHGLFFRSPLARCVLCLFNYQLDLTPDILLAQNFAPYLS